jgi:hypothetical protein
MFVPEIDFITGNAPMRKFYTRRNLNRRTVALAGKMLAHVSIITIPVDTIPGGAPVLLVA